MYKCQVGMLKVPSLAVLNPKLPLSCESDSCISLNGIVFRFVPFIVCFTVIFSLLKENLPKTCIIIQTWNSQLVSPITLNDLALYEITKGLGVFFFFFLKGSKTRSTPFSSALVPFDTADLSGGAESDELSEVRPLAWPVTPSEISR